MADAKSLLEFAREMELFVGPDGGCYATYCREAGHVETQEVNGKTFQSYLINRFMLANGRAPSQYEMNNAVATYAAQARMSGITRDVFVRVAGHEGRIYLDIADSQCHVVEIDAEGWRLVADPPVRFRRPPGMEALPSPVHDGTIEALRPFVNVKDDDDFVLLVGFLLGALQPTGPFAHLELLGEQGSAKSTTARVVRGLIDPNYSPLRAAPKSDRDLAITANNQWMPVWDNLSSMDSWFSDGLCRLSTGGGFSTRALYSDSDEKLFELMRPAIFNGIGDVAWRSDLLDRTVVLRLPCIEGATTRVPEAELRSAYELARPGILGALLDGVSRALRDVATVRAGRLPRLADWALWVTAAEPALGWPAGTIVTAFFANQQESNVVVLEGSPIAASLIELASGDGWQGTASELLARLHRQRALQGRSVGLPKSPNSLRTKLNRLIPNLRRVGVAVEFSRSGKEGTRTISIRSSEKSVSVVSRVSDSEEDAA